MRYAHTVHGILPNEQHKVQFEKIGTVTAKFERVATRSNSQSEWQFVPFGYDIKEKTPHKVVLKQTLSLFRDMLLVVVFY